MSDTEERPAIRGEARLLGFAILLPTAVTLLYFVVLASAPAVVQQAAYGLGKIVQFGLPAVWIFAVRRERFEWLRPTWSGLVPNLLFGGAVVGLMMGLYWLWLNPTGYLSAESPAGREIIDKVRGFGISSIWGYAALGAFYALVHSGLEEYYWRWFVFGQSREKMSLAAAITVSSLGFMLHHVILLGVYFDWALLPTALFSLAVAIGGVVWAWLYHRSGSLFGPWMGHLLIDAGIFLVGYDVVRAEFL